MGRQRRVREECELHDCAVRFVVREKRFWRTAERSAARQAAALHSVGRRLAADGECEKNPVFMKLECASSCTTQGAPPQDKSDKCKKWTELGECTRNADFMSVECATSCKDRFSLPNKNAMCEQWVATGECLRNTAFMELECAASCHNHTLSERGRADNRTEDCLHLLWAARGECEKNADFMRSEKGDCLPFCEAAAKAAAEREAAAKEAGKEMASAAAARAAERAQMAERKWQGADGTQVAGRTPAEVGGIDVRSVSGKGAHVHPFLSGVPAQVYTRASLP